MPRFHRAFEQKNRSRNSDDNCSLLAYDSPSEDNAIDIPNSSSDSLEEAVFAAGSFWRLEAAFGRLDGVVGTSAGYYGGFLRNPNYREVLERRTGHTEAVKVVYDSRRVNYRSLCRVFWESHDPTDKIYLRFGVDTHYSSVIFYRSEEEKRQAQESRVRRQMKLNRRIVTKILPCGSAEFYLAESEHQKYYLQKNYPSISQSLGLTSSEQFAESHFACKINGLLADDVHSGEGEIRSLLARHQLPLKTRMAVEGLLLELKDRRAKWVSFD